MIQRRIKRAQSFLVGAAALTIVLTGCSAPGQSGNGTGSEEGPIKVALVNAQSGQVSSLGAWSTKGVTLALDEANADGGIDGRQIEYTIYDDQGDPTVGTNLAHKVAGDGSIFMFGSSTSGVTLAMAPIMESNEIPFISDGQSPELGKLGNPFLFLNSPTSVTFSETLVDYVEPMGIETVAMISNNGAYGVGEHDAFIAQLDGTEMKVVDDQVVTPEQKDYSSALTVIKQANPDAIFLGMEEVQAGLVVKQARQLGIDAQIIGGGTLGTPVYIESAGADAAEGTICSVPYLGNDTSDETRKFGDAYEAKFGEAAEAHGAKAYDGAQIVIQALRADPDLRGADLAEAIRAIDYAGLNGDFDFDENGVGVHAAQMGIIKDGKLTGAP